MEIERTPEMAQTTWDGTDRRNVQHWRIKREISLGDLIAFASAAFAVVYAYTTLDKRVTLLEQAAITQRDVDRRQDEDSVRYQVRIEEVLKSMSNKMDRLIEADRRQR